MDISKGRDGSGYPLPHEQIEYDRAHFAERLVYYIGAFVPEKDIMRRFGWTRAEMDAACDACFSHMSFSDVYQYIRADVLMEGKSLIEELAKGGNPSALKIFSDEIMRLNREEDEERGRLTISIDV